MAAVKIATNLEAKKTEIYSPPFLETLSLKSILVDKIKGVNRATLLLEVLGESLFLLSSSFWQLLAFPRLVAAPLSSISRTLCVLSSTSPPLCMCSNLFLSSSYKEACKFALGPLSSHRPPPPPSPISCPSQSYWSQGSPRELGDTTRPYPPRPGLCILH